VSATREELQTWLRECMAEVEQDGALSLVALQHYQSNGEATEVHVFRAGSPHFSDADRMGEILDQISGRHARGILGGGAQQYEVLCFYGTTTKPKRRMPFVRVGLTSHGFTAGGGLATEPPNAVGMTAQAQRWGEIVLQGTMTERQAVVAALATLVRDLHSANSAMTKENFELLLALKKSLADQADTAATTATKILQAKHMAQLQMAAVKLAPGLINGLAGKPIFAEASGDTAILAAFQRALTPENVEAMSAMFAGGDLEKQAAFATLMNRMVDLQHQEQTEAQQLKELQQMPLGIDPLEDAGGEGVAFIDPRAELLRVVGGAPKQLETNGSNGHGNGHTNGSGANGHTVSGAGRTDGDVLLDDLLAAITGPQLSFALSAIGTKNPGLAQRLKERANAAKKEK